MSNGKGKMKAKTINESENIASAQFVEFINSVISGELHRRCTESSGGIKSVPTKIKATFSQRTSYSLDDSDIPSSSSSSYSDSFLSGAFDSTTNSKELRSECHSSIDNILNTLCNGKQPNIKSNSENTIGKQQTLDDKSQNLVPNETSEPISDEKTQDNTSLPTSKRITRKRKNSITETTEPKPQTDAAKKKEIPSRARIKRRRTPSNIKNVESSTVDDTQNNSSNEDSEKFSL